MKKVEEVWTPLLEQAGRPDNQPSVEKPEQLQGGVVWGRRLHRNIWLPDCFRPGQLPVNKERNSVADNTLCPSLVVQ